MKAFFTTHRKLFIILTVVLFILSLAAPGCLIPAAICLAIVLANKPAKKSKFEPTEYEYVLRDKGEDILRNAPHPVEGIGYANFPEYTVKGRKRTTNRVNTRHVRAASEEAVRAYAVEAEDLMEPLEISLAEFWAAPTTSEYDLTIPAGASQWDAQIFESCVLAKDTKHIPSGFMEYATGLGIPLSWLGGRDYAAAQVFSHVDAREMAALYGYAVHCSLRGQTPGNIAEDPHHQMYIQFSDAATRDAKAYESIIKRPGSDMWAPAKNTNAYRFAEAYFVRS